jgi:hypothetical protein
MSKIYGNEGANPIDEGIDWSKAKRFKKTAIIHAIKMDEDFEVEHKDGKIQGKKGDYLVQGKRGDKYALPADLFEETHQELAPISPDQRKIQEQQQQIESLRQTIKEKDQLQADLNELAQND